jgi:hypothetical protein
MGRILCTTLRDGNTDITLEYPEKDLEHMMNLGLSIELGVFQNFSVAKGQDPKA